MSAVLKIPIQFVILLIGVLVFLFFHFHQSPLLFNPVTQAEFQDVPAYRQLQGEHQEAHRALRDVSLRLSQEAGNVALRQEYLRSFEAREAVRGRAIALVKETQNDLSYTDVNYVFPSFVTGFLPMGVVGLMIAAIFAAAMSSIAAELNSLSTASVMDFYRRHFRTSATDAHYLRVAKLATLFWGVMACIVAVYATRLGSLIEVVNRFGSFFYGSLLGVFILALGTKWATARGAFFGLLVGMGTVGVVSATTSISFLWYNIVGAVAVVGTAAVFAVGERLMGGSAHR